MSMIEKEELEKATSMHDFFVGRKTFGDIVVSREFIEDQDYKSRLFYTNVRTREAQNAASLLILHGFGEHSGRYLDVAAQFARASLEVHLIDFRGFGHSSGPRFMTSLSELYEDIVSVLTKAYKSLPLFVFAHSLGAGTFLSFMQLNPSLKIAGLVLSNPWLDFKPHQTFGWLPKQILIRLPKIADVD